MYVLEFFALLSLGVVLCEYMVFATHYIFHFVQDNRVLNIYE